MTRLINPDFKITESASNKRLIAQALTNLEQRYGALSVERIVDYCVSSAYAFKDRGDKWTIRQALGAKSIDRASVGQKNRFYEDEWLETVNIVRFELIDLIVDKRTHPLSKFVYMPTEESTKQRAHNKEGGFLLCQMSTLGWSPFSYSCQQCRFVDDCQDLTKEKLPELYRLRIEYDKE